ncbi:MAG TPA: NAD-dependent epimerase/dehydratase family protein [Reyranella sp.]|nr:NAD-dependent epimerase/dehydratase family protein [Reyranella sp.]
MSATKEKHALVTGGAGFIGSHLVDDLIGSGFKVTVLDALLPQVHADGDNDADGWPTYLNEKAIRIKGNVLEPGLVGNILEDGVTHLVHMAASVGVGQSATDPYLYTQNNDLGAAVIMEALNNTKRHSLERMVVASSMSIYGEGSYVAPGGRRQERVRERSMEQLRNRQWEVTDGAGNPFSPVPTAEDKVLEPASIYALGKYVHERMFLVHGKARGIPTVALRLFNAYGSRQALSNPYTGVAAIFIGRLLNDQAPMINEDGEQKRDFVHVKDVTDAFMHAITSEREVWDAFNVGSGEAITVNRVARVLAEKLHKNIAPEITNKYRIGDIRHCFADIGKMQHMFGWSPKRRFEDGMRELIDWVRRAPLPVDRTLEMRAAQAMAGVVV